MKLPDRELPLVDPKTGKIDLNWYVALQTIAAGSMPFGVFFGTGVPTLRAPKGAVYIRTDGAMNERAYINTNGGTTWTAFITAA